MRRKSSLPFCPGWLRLARFRCWAVLVPACVALQLRSASSQAELNHRQRIPKSKLVLGSSLEQIVSATERCSRESQAPCSVDEYSAELRSGSALSLPSFLMDRLEVSQQDYSRCVQAGRCRPAKMDLLPALMAHPDFPAVMVNLDDAKSYCAFTDGQVPSEAHFEAAAAGEANRSYPWGNLFHSGLANFGSRRAPYTDQSDGFELFAHVAEFQSGRSPQGVQQLSGNVAEWTVSPFIPHGEAAVSGSSQFKRVVVKGGSFRSLPVDLRAQARRGMAPTEVAVDVGFRCIKENVINPER